MMTEPNGIDKYTEGSSKTKWDKLADRIESNKKFIVVLLAGLGIAYHFGYLQVPNLGLAEWFIVFAGFAGLSFGSSAVMWELSDYLEDKRVNIDFGDMNGVYSDMVKVPKKTFAEYELITESGIVEARTLGHKNVLQVRSIDFDNKYAVPAGEFPDDDRYPDDTELHAVDADMRKIQQYRNAMLEDAEKAHNVILDREVIQEQAEGDVINRFADALAELREADVEVSELEDEEELRQTAEFALQAAQSQNEGDTE